MTITEKNEKTWAAAAVAIALAPSHGAQPQHTPEKRQVRELLLAEPLLLAIIHESDLPQAGDDHVEATNDDTNAVQNAHGGGVSPNGNGEKNVFVGSLHKPRLVLALGSTVIIK